MTTKYTALDRAINNALGDMTCEICGHDDCDCDLNPALYKCCCKRCPGYPFKASERAHPLSTCAEFDGDWVCASGGGSK